MLLFKAYELIVPRDAKSLVVTDLNNDARPDFLIGRNNDPMMAYENHTNAGKILNVTLEGPAKNPTAIGAKVQVKLTNGKTQTAEMLGGSGYLSQSSSTLTFGLGKDNAPASITVRWPGGTSKDYTTGLDQPKVSLKP